MPCAMLGTQETTMNLPAPKLVQLDPSDRHVTRDVAAFYTVLGYPPEVGLPMHLCFVLADGVELRLPVSAEIACKIRDTLTNQLSHGDGEAGEGEPT